jgi:hypothetical protein
MGNSFRHACPGRADRTAMREAHAVTLFSSAGQQNAPRSQISVGGGTAVSGESFRFFLRSFLHIFQALMTSNFPKKRRGRPTCPTRPRLRNNRHLSSTGLPSIAVYTRPGYQLILVRHNSSRPAERAWRLAISRQLHRPRMSGRPRATWRQLKQKGERGRQKRKQADRSLTIEQWCR